MSNVTGAGKRYALAEFVDQWQAESDRLAYIVQKARDAADHGVGAMPTDEALAAALVLKRVDWLSERDCTVAQALARIRPDWAELIPLATSVIEDEGKWPQVLPST